MFERIFINKIYFPWKCMLLHRLLCINMIFAPSEMQISLDGDASEVKFGNPATSSGASCIILFHRLPKYPSGLGGTESGTRLYAAWAPRSNKSRSTSREHFY